MFERHSRLIPTLALATAGCLWGTGFFFGKIALNEMSVSNMVLFRFAFTCVGLLPFIFFDRPRFAGGEWVWVIAASVLGVPIQYLVQYEGLSLTTVSHASLMVGTLPMLLAIAAVLFSGERLHIGGWLALVASTCGAGLIALSGKAASTEHASMHGDLLVVLSMLAAIAWILISKRLMRQHSAVMVTAVVYWIGTLILAAVVIATSGVPPVDYSSRTWIAVAEQGLLATASTTLLWNWGLKRVPASQAGIFVNLEPLVGAILGVFVLHEVLTSMALVGGAMILGAAVYFSYKPKKLESN